MRESEVEKILRDAVERAGGEAYKFTVPGRRGAPDRLVLLPVPPEHRAIVGKYVRFIELKRPGKKSTGLAVAQRRWRDRLLELGYRAEVHDFINVEKEKF